MWFEVIQRTIRQNSCIRRLTIPQFRDRSLQTRLFQSPDAKERERHFENEADAIEEERVCVEPCDLLFVTLLDAAIHRITLKARGV